MFKRLCIIGLGLIGGSIARAARRQGLAAQIVSYAPENFQANLQTALELGVIDNRYTDVFAAVEQADCVIIATPVGAVQNIFRELAPHWRDDVVYSDACSTKGSVVAAALAVFGRPHVLDHAEPVVDVAIFAGLMVQVDRLTLVHLAFGFEDALRIGAVHVPGVIADNPDVADDVICFVDFDSLVSVVALERVIRFARAYAVESFADRTFGRCRGHATDSVTERCPESSGFFGVNQLLFRQRAIEQALGNLAIVLFIEWRRGLIRLFGQLDMTGVNFFGQRFDIKLRLLLHLAYS